MPIANILILLFVLAMIYWWALQGFFSAFIHLIVVLVAGSLAIAFWEPLAFNFGMQWAPAYAWGLWLLGPFVLLLIGLRVLVDQVVKKNVQFPNLVSNILGGVCGFFSAVITAGLVVIGLGFLPLGASLGGYQPYAIAGGGQVTGGGSSLWVPVDRWATDAFVTLGHTGFSTRTPLGAYQPDLARQAAIFRLNADDNASVVALPESVEVAAVATAPTPVEQLGAAVALALGEDFREAGNRVVVVDTRWDNIVPTYDRDNAVRVPATQVRLVTREERIGGGGRIAIHTPVGFSKVVDEKRVFYPFDAADVVAFSNLQEDSFAWVFAVPAEEEPRFLRVRNLRFDLSDAPTDPAAVATLIGELAPTAEADPEAGAQTAEGPSEVGAREGTRAGHVASDIELTAALPSPTSKNFVTGLETTGNSIMSGEALAQRAPGGLSQNTRIEGVWVPPHSAGVRLRLEQDQAQSILGRSMSAAASLGGVFLIPAQGEPYAPIGYVWRKANGEQAIKVTRDTPIRSARELPVAQMGGGDELYLYFVVPKGTEITAYQIGPRTTQEIEPPLVAQ